MYAIVKNGIIEKTGELRELFPNVSFSVTGPNEDWCTDNGVYLVDFEDPEYDSKTSRIETCSPYYDGVGVKGKRVVAKSAEDIANERHNAIIYAIQNNDLVFLESLTNEESTKYTVDMAFCVRERRDQLLSSCDWTQAKDISNDVSSQWASYRQALRNIPQQESFPWVILWPEKPV